MQILGGRNVEIEQASEGQVDGGDFIEVDALVDAAQRLDVFFVDGERRLGAQGSPLVATEPLESGNVAVVNHDEETSVTLHLAR